jgi:hypothetical protein
LSKANTQQAVRKWNREIWFHNKKIFKFWLVRPLNFVSLIY